MVQGRFAILGTENSGKSTLLNSFPEQVNQSGRLSIQTQISNPVVETNEQEAENFQDRVFNIYQGENGVVSIQVADYSGDIVILLKKWRSIVQTKRFEKQHK